MSSLKEIKEEILKSKRIGLSFHTSPDGDAIGSTLALLNALRHLGKDSYIISRDVISDNLSFLSFANEIDGNTLEPKEGTDLVMILDCGNVERISADLSNYKGKIINIDHHISNEEYGFINYVDVSAAATCEISYLLAKELGIDFNNKTDVEINIGNAVYTGIVTDTGSFRHSNVTKRTHKIVSELIELGVNNSKVHSNLFDNKPFEKVKLMGCVLSNIELALENKVAVLEIPKGMLEEFNLKNTDTSDIISVGLGIKGVEVSMLLKEVEDGVKGSLRSKNDVDVRKVAEVYGGGGHIKAAGVMQKGVDIETAKENLLKILKEELDS
ncbi:MULTISPECIES: DHH family phosphoesterase [Clostridium]|jgi:Exopolyphosphatase-related proteins|uniref:Bifunctional oligoribonuclease/PAP phosphatase NrnA n=5 Tax=Clostridium TaxID=1485 RepID=A0AAE2RWM2_CLOBE|nr:MULTISPECIES: bifunctional oligoribonuclease/PAP phosphatase NrnA [Clostridium]ABR33386.1 phosphoesterase, RecJ domain protein [Clostridium beijerinckii NCIMB 8052]AIU03106.1 phosphoesterase domain-containing protein [Clostridium beijerinckii ATCC 35702]ALB47463.1 bifunctional oligoribonuclease/PAP phosphatase NrnA [Clostridium beijerinckii NRRL B-598]AVK50262.1 1-pyrroline-5-carboxylate dehydrogenase [Clostridium sp. MF28]MBC2457118.1 bifunctional oligoribonuclease/PAP phosphatase NrnA [Cl